MKIWGGGAALTYGLQSLETYLLTQEENPAGLAAINHEFDRHREKLSGKKARLSCHQFRFNEVRVGG